MINGRCRNHGGAATGAPRGERHGNYKHGKRTLETMARHKNEHQRLRLLNKLMQQLGMAASTRTRKVPDDGRVAALLKEYEALVD